MKNIFFTFVLSAVVLVVAACAGPPFVYKRGEFDRTSINFGQPVRDISNLTICYSSSSTTPRKVNKMAIKECATFNKMPEFVEKKYNVCPLATPIAAVFYCLGSSLYVSGDGQVVPGGTLMNYDGIEFRY